jgi:valyl-tRNA synthetase
MPADAATDLPKTYDPAAVEPDMLRRWLDAGAFHAQPDDPGEPFSIVIPPPNVTAALHLGHALNNTLQDVLVRHARMTGKNAVWLPGTDHAGIATQTVVEKRLLQDEGKRRVDFDRETFVARVQAWKDQYEQRITDQLQLMGCSCDYDRQAFTMDTPRSRAVREAFFRMFRDGLIYRGKRLVNWDPATQTALANDEVEMETVDGSFWYLKYPLVEEERDEETKRLRDEVRSAETAGPDNHSVSSSPRHSGPSPALVTVATTRPETLLGDTAVAVNPNDPDRKHLIGRKVRVPIVDRVVPIVGDEHVVIPDPDSDDAKARYASGFLKVTPAHDFNDAEIGKRHAQAIADVAGHVTINVFGPDASISLDHGWADQEPAQADNGELAPLLGLSREDARKQIVKWFDQHDLLEEVRPYRHAVGHSYRSHVPVEPYLSDQWYVAMRKAIPGLPDEGRFDDTDIPRSSFAGLALSALDPGDAWNYRVSPVVPERRTGVPPVIPPQGGTRFETHRRHLPHWELGGSTYFVTFRLAHGELTEAERQVTLDACQHWHGERADIHLAVVMPDHVHLLLTPRRDVEGAWYRLVDLMQSIKSFSAHAINKIRGREGKVWQQESFDRIIRDEPELEDKWNYIRKNPVTAGLVERPEDYAFMATGESAVPADDGRDARPTGEPSRNLTFTPARYGTFYRQRLLEAPDWCISRQLWWGHRIPVWSKPSDEATKRRSEEAGSGPGVAVWEDGDTTYACLRDDDPEQIAALEAEGFERDPDVLDTWFSSGLWPLSTLGWPEDTAALRTWNPTDVLCTAREIIVLWVTRMVMFNVYLRDGETERRRDEVKDPAVSATSSLRDIVSSSLPFSDVFIHAMIQDGHGQKMSKSLGNGVDPVDIIHSHGADAMRFTLCQMTTQTQDVRMPVDLVSPHTGEAFTPRFIGLANGTKVAAPVQDDPTSDGKQCVSSFGLASGKATPTDQMPLARNTSEKFDGGQRFCNKVWNAVRFALGALGDVEPGDGHPQALGELDLPSRWVLSRLAATVATVDRALAEYQFNQVADTLYDFFWRDLCDWYIEAVKPTLAEDAGQRAVLVACLDASLRLLHPVMPFLTERLWEALRSPGSEAGKAGDNRSLAGLELADHPLLCRAPWPRPAASLADASAEADFQTLRQLVGVVREVRSMHNVPPRQVVAVSVRHPAEAAPQARVLGPLMERLGQVQLVESGPDVARPDDAVAASARGWELYLHGLHDSGKERQRLEGRLEELTRQEQTLGKRLDNPGYVQKAPAHLVEQTREQLQQTQEELASVREQLQRA